VVYTILDDQIQVRPIADGDYEFEIAYWEKFDSLSSTTTTNWLLTNHPDIYLFGTLLEATLYVGEDDPRMQVWAERYKAAIQALQRSDDQGTWSGAPLTVRSDVGNP
jgi:hypothetical protein